MDPRTPAVAWEFDAIGTRWRIHRDRDLSAHEREAVSETVEAFDLAWSRFRDDSSVSHLARAGGSVALPPDAADMLDAYAELTAATAGAVNPLVGASLVSLGYDADYTLRGGTPVAAEAAWREVVRWDDGVLTLTRPVLVDVGALGKGRLVDRVLAALGGEPGETVVVDASGDLVVRGGPVRIALEHPYDATMAIGVATIADGALCGSAANRRVWGEGLHHVLDARTGVPVETVAATWAFSPDAMRADAIATALFFPGGAELADRWDVAWVRMFTDGRAQRSEGLSVELFT